MTKQIEPTDPEVDEVDLVDEDMDDDEEEDFEGFDLQEITDCLKADDGRTIGDTLAAISDSLASQNKILIKILSAVKTN